MAEMDKDQDQANPMNSNTLSPQVTKVLYKDLPPHRQFSPHHKSDAQLREYFDTESKAKDIHPQATRRAIHPSNTRDHQALIPLQDGGFLICYRDSTTEYRDRNGVLLRTFNGGHPSMAQIDEDVFVRREEDTGSNMVLVSLTTGEIVYRWVLPHNPPLSLIALKKTYHLEAHNQTLESGNHSERTKVLVLGDAKGNINFWRIDKNKDGNYSATRLMSDQFLKCGKDFCKVVAMCETADGNLVAVTEPIGRMHVWDLTKLKGRKSDKKWSLPLKLDEDALVVADAGNGYIAFGTLFGRLGLINIHRDTSPRLYSFFKWRVERLCLLNDGTLAVSDGQELVRLNPADGSCVSKFWSPYDLYELAQLKDGTIVTIRGDHVIELWKIDYSLRDRCALVIAEELVNSDAKHRKSVLDQFKEGLAEELYQLCNSYYENIEEVKREQRLQLSLNKEALLSEREEMGDDYAYDGFNSDEEPDGAVAQ
eukprot:TRINITY_DN8283_c0_g1_i1.p1 TRINITY_DN8283_c0_g1~~TRINITY_DN8283_c0_g1_i1.p1  ORF type:complete len:480 (-),score=80.88 TRINITY_DN8283_c0_g1_i1:87-1526(-)